jgi:hypothetical protein
MSYHASFWLHNAGGTGIESMDAEGDNDDDKEI